MNTNINPKPEWSINFPPTPPEIPVPPKEFNEVSERVIIGHFKYHVSIRDIEIPDGFELEDLVIENEPADTDFAIVFSRTKLVPNEMYEGEMNTFYSKMKKYQSDYEKYKEEWNAWVNNNLLQQSIEAAKELLRKHG
jgi:hypothetical protein